MNLTLFNYNAAINLFDGSLKISLTYNTSNGFLLLIYVFDSPKNTQ